MTITIDCPVCSSGNHFFDGQVRRPVTCRDCGFLLSESPASLDSTLFACVLCQNNRWFYYESPFSLRIFGRDLVCYVCEAHYKGVSMGKADDKFIPSAQVEARNSAFSKRWEERVKTYLNLK